MHALALKPVRSRRARPPVSAPSDIASPISGISGGGREGRGAARTVPGTPGHSVQVLSEGSVLVLGLRPQSPTPSVACSPRP